jgi:hypothetical protein
MNTAGHSTLALNLNQATLLALLLRASAIAANPTVKRAICLV